ncbi:MAG: WD40 repeat domain-containing protein [Synechococcus sp.]
MLASAAADAVILWTQVHEGPRAWRPEPLLWHGRRVNALAFAPGSTLLASASSDGTVALWYGRGRMLQPLEGQGCGFNVLAWRPDGCHLAAGDANGRWWPCRRGSGSLGDPGPASSAGQFGRSSAHDSQ